MCNDKAFHARQLPTVRSKLSFVITDGNRKDRKDAGVGMNLDFCNTEDRLVFIRYLPWENKILAVVLIPSGQQYPVLVGDKAPRTFTRNN